MSDARPPRTYMSVPHMSGDEQPFIADAFASNWLSSVGPSLDGFEREVAERLGGVHTLGVSSGTAAIHLILRYAGVRAGDRVAVQSATFAGGAFPVVYQGAEPVFIDSEPVTGGMDPALAAEYLDDAARRNELPRAMIVAHLYGQHCDVDPIADACERHGVVLIEDAAESLGATYRGRQTATRAPLSALSFNGNKIITTTGGGMCVVRDPAAIPVLRKWSTQSKEAKVEYEHVELGYNYRMSNVLAAIGRGQLRVLDERVRQRQAVFARYAAAFAGVPGIAMQEEAAWGTHTRWLSVAFLDASVHGRTPDDVVVALERDNIEARPIWRPMHTQPLFAGCRAVGGAVSEQLFRTGICLPSSSRLAATPDVQDRVIEKLLAFLAR